MKTLRRNNIKAIAEVLNKITEKRRRIMEEKNKPVAKMKTKGKKERVRRERIPLKNHRSSVVRVEPSGWRMVTQNDDDDWMWCH